MADISAPALEPAGEFRVGRVLSRALTITSRNLVQFAALVAVPLLPTLLFSNRGATPHAASGSAILSLLVSIVLGFLSQAVVIHAAFQNMRGRRISVGESFGKALSRLLPVIGLSLVMGIGVALGLAFFIVPGLFLAAGWYVALPVCVVESAPVFRSLGRSDELTRGHRWQIIGLYVLLLVISVVVAAIIGGIFGLLGGPLLIKIAVFVVQVLVGAYGAVVVVVAYHDLRVAKEGVDIDHIASVFD